MDKKKILIIEDEMDLADLVKIRLEANNYEVVVSYDGQKALEKIKEYIPDLILLDIMLPGIDGYSLYDIFRKNKIYSKIPIIMFTAKAQPEDVAFGNKIGVDAYITKPFDPSDLLEKIKMLLKDAK